MERNEGKVKINKERWENMLETMSLDAKTLIIKSDNEEDLSRIVEIININDKMNSINSFLDFASKNRVVKKNYKFVRENCYDR